MTTVVVVLVVYFLPTIIGRSRAVTNVGSVFVINVFLGWTLIGWVVALAMAARTVRQEPPRLEQRRSRRALEQHPTDLARSGPMSDEEPQDPHVLV